MIEKSVYVAFDGKEFEDAHACLAYEKECYLKDSGTWREINMVFVFSEDMSVHRTSGSEEEYKNLFTSNPQYLYFVNDEDAEDFQMIVNKLDFTTFTKFDEAGLWCYDYLAGWDKADDLRESCETQIASCTRRVEELNKIEDECEDLIAWG